MSKQALLGMTLIEIREATKFLDLPNFAACEIALWIYSKGATSFKQFTNISKIKRQVLSNNFEIGLQPPSKVRTSIDGTRKYLFPVKNNRFIEAAYIPEGKRHTLCISSQVGCKFGCSFCMTGKQGFQGQLTSGEIINQVLSIEERELITNIVFMGMGEPFDNTDEVLKSLEIMTADYGMELNPKKITVSTVGILPGMKRFINETRCQLAISLHSPFDEERSMIMPVEKKYPIRHVIETLKKHDFGKQKNISFEYILFRGFNDSVRHINQLARLLNGLRCKINLIRFHKIPDSSLQETSEAALHEFRNKLKAKGITTTIRASRGEDISAACGLLSTKALFIN